MFHDVLRRFLEPPSADPLARDDARLAVAALLVRVARADDRYSATEAARIDRILARRYHLPEAIAAARRS